MPTELKPMGVPVVESAEGVRSPLSPTIAALYGREKAISMGYMVLKEEPWHTQAAFLFAAGNLSAQEVAEVVGHAAQTCRNLLRQEWFQRKVIQIISDHGGQDVMELFRAEAFNSLVTLVEIRDDPKVPASVRSANARDIIDRAYGKAKQVMEFSDSPRSNDPVGEAKRLEEENARLSGSFNSPRI